MQRRLILFIPCLIFSVKAMYSKPSMSAGVIDPVSEAIKISSIIAEWKERVELYRSDKMYLPENITAAYDGMIRSKYGIPRSEIIAGAFDNVSEIGKAWGWESFDQGIAFTNRKIYIRINKSRKTEIDYVSMEFLSLYKMISTDNTVVFTYQNSPDQLSAMNLNRTFDLSNSSITPAELVILIEDVSKGYIEYRSNDLPSYIKNELTGLQGKFYQNMEAEEWMNSIFSSLETIIEVCDATDFMCPMISELCVWIGIGYCSKFSDVESAKKFWQAASDQGNRKADYFLVHSLCP